MAWLQGKPVYADRLRHLIDVTSKPQPQSWKPANVAAQKLFRCVECLRDLEILLQSGSRLKNKAKQRRKLKILLTPLHSLVGAIRDLAIDLENNQDTICRLPSGARQLIPEIRSQLLQISKIGKGTFLSAARNKISAHIDKELSAEEMRALLSHADPHQVGLWLHTCVSVISDFIKLPVYFWSCEPDEGTMRILFSLPFVVTFALDSNGKAVRILDVHMIKQPPYYEIVLLLKRVVKNSDWMFDSKSSRILNFTEDQPGDTWAKSLQWLPYFSGSVPKEFEPSIVPKIKPDDGWFLLIPINVPFFINQGEQRVTKREDLSI